MSAFGRDQFRGGAVSLRTWKASTPHGGTQMSAQEIVARYYEAWQTQGRRHE